MKKIIIAGGTGFIGKNLNAKFTALGYQVIIISRQTNHVNWNNKEAIIAALENAEMLINLAGKSVNCRYNKKNKIQILNSRVNTTIALGNAILQCKNPPLLWFNSSTATIYRNAQDKPMTEADGEIGTGFSVNVATAWEKSFFDFALPNTRQIALRISIVLGKEDGFVPVVKKLVNLGFGGKQGSGKQMFSWVHIEDIFSIIIFLHQKKQLSGVFNIASPNAVNNKVLMQTFRQQQKIFIGLPTPTLLLKMGAAIINTEPELVLKSRWVYPQKLLQAGYHFTFNTIEQALKNILSN